MSAAMKGRIGFVARLLTGALLGFAGWIKLGDAQTFSTAVEKFALPVGWAGVQWLSYAVPWMEFLAGAALVLGVRPRGAALASAALLLAFMAGIASLMVRGVAVDCPCFGQMSVLCSGPLGTCHLVRNGAFVGLACLVWAWGPGPFALWPERAAARGGGGGG